MFNTADQDIKFRALQRRSAEIHTTPPYGSEPMCLVDAWRICTALPRKSKCNQPGGPSTPSTIDSEAFRVPGATIIQTVPRPRGTVNFCSEHGHSTLLLVVNKSSTRCIRDVPEAKARRGNTHPTSDSACCTTHTADLFLPRSQP